MFTPSLKHIYEDACERHLDHSPHARVAELYGDLDPSKLTVDIHWVSQGRDFENFEYFTRERLFLPSLDVFSHRHNLGLVPALGPFKSTRVSTFAIEPAHLLDILAEVVQMPPE